MKILFHRHFNCWQIQYNNIQQCSVINLVHCWQIPCSKNILQFCSRTVNIFCFCYRQLEQASSVDDQGKDKDVTCSDQQQQEVSDLLLYFMRDLLNIQYCFLCYVYLPEIRLPMQFYFDARRCNLKIRDYKGFKVRPVRGF